MKIPVFVSCPTSLNTEQEQARGYILRQLGKFGLEARALGRSDYPTEFPLREVMVIARHCSGAVILGFEQFRANGGIRKKGTKNQSKVDAEVKFPSPWNNLEAGILFGLNMPLLIFREPGIDGGVFDDGVTDVFIHRMPMGKIAVAENRALGEVFLKWQAKVRERYYR